MLDKKNPPFPSLTTSKSAKLNPFARKTWHEHRTVFPSAADIKGLSLLSTRFTLSRQHSSRGAALIGTHSLIVSLFDVSRALEGTISTRERERKRGEKKKGRRSGGSFPHASPLFVRRLTSGNSCELVTPSRRGSFDGIMAECRWRQLGEKIRKRMSRSESKRISIKSRVLKK